MSCIERPILTNILDIVPELADHVSMCARSVRTVRLGGPMNSEAKIQELEAKVAELTEVVERFAAPDRPSRVETVAMPVEPTRASRRNMLKLAGAAVVGTAAAVATNALPAAAADGSSILLGQDGTANNTYTTPTGINFTGANTDGVLFKVQDGTTWTASSATYPSALAGYASISGSARNGIYGYTQWADHAGIVGYGSFGTAGSLGGRFAGARAAINLVSSGATPAVVATAHKVGDIIRTDDGSAWYVTADGTPGTLRKLAGPTSAGTLHLLATPVRVYDSRVGEVPATAPKTPLSGATRTIDCTLNSSGVPAGAAGLVLNVTALSLSAVGYLSVSPGATGFSGTSTLNWNAVSAVVANSVTVGAGAGATIDVTVGGGGNTNFIVDVFGFYA